ncbi:MAG: gliding motility-associated C-terminal domain-containing protein [Flavobacteriaceae bacterium]|nr:gliding motility-associated C-terminal domain-containing protein [Flavobacteriaceae bacterium]
MNTKIRSNKTQISYGFTVFICILFVNITFAKEAFVSGYYYNNLEEDSGLDGVNIDELNVLDTVNLITHYSSDTDGDGVLDTTETTNGTDAADPCSYNVEDITETITAEMDCDGDGVIDATEILDGTDPKDACTYVPDSITETVTANFDCFSQINVTNRAEVFGTEIGDTIEFTVTIENTGSATLVDLSFTDEIKDFNEQDLVLTQELMFESSDMESPEGVLLVGDVATYTAKFTVTQDAIKFGGIYYSVTGMGTSPSGSVIEDTSDDGDDLDGNTEDDRTVVELGCLMVFNEFSPNGDGINDFFVINCLENYPNNKLEVYNRWGNMVYEMKGYDNSWSGSSNGRSIHNSSHKLPIGTYYYVLNLGDGSKPNTGWIYINR